MGSIAMASALRKGAASSEKGTALHKHMAKVLQKKGRRGDTMLAHINKDEAALLKRRGGSGSRNPKTGLREYFEGPGGDSDPGGLGGDAGSAGLGSDAAGGGGAAGGDSDPANLGGDPGVSPGLGSTGGIAPGDSDPAMLGGQTPLGAPAPTGGGFRGLLDRNIGKPLANYFGNQANTMALMAGPLSPAVRGMALARDQLEAMGANISDDYSGLDAVGAGGGMDDITGGRVVAPLGPAAEAFQRPGEQAEPTSLSLGMPGLTDLQRRAMIATYGTQGVESKYRDAATKNYYAKLLARGLINDQNQPIEGGQVLPIEQNYIRDVYGKEPREGDTRSLLNDLRSYWAS